MRSRATLPVLALLVAALFVSRVAFVSPPASQQQQQSSQIALRGAEVPTAALGAAAGVLAPAQPAHALLLQDEILSISFAIIGATLWGIVLGFVLLRLQEAFPE